MATNTIETRQPGAPESFLRETIEGRGVCDKHVLRAMAKVVREHFVPEEFRSEAYADYPLPIGHGQTISQPYIVAYMIEALRLKGDEKVLEIGAGSGYAAAVLAEIAAEVYAIERIEQLAALALKNLNSAGYANVCVRHGDGTLGWPEKAPFDAILVSAGAPEAPEALLRQLSIGGRLVIPVGHDLNGQELQRITRTAEDGYDCEYLTGVRFVPLIGEEGWHMDDRSSGKWRCHSFPLLMPSP